VRPVTWGAVMKSVLYHTDTLIIQPSYLSVRFVLPLYATANHPAGATLPGSSPLLHVQMPVCFCRQSALVQVDGLGGGDQFMFQGIHCSTEIHCPYGKYARSLTDYTSSCTVLFWTHINLHVRCIVTFSQRDKLILIFFIDCLNFPYQSKLSLKDLSSSKHMHYYL
jgi:hypothetical protein